MYKKLKKTDFLETQQFTDLSGKILEVFDALEASKIDISKAERKTLRVFSTNRAGYIDKVERAIAFYKDVFPANYNKEKISEFKIIYNDLTTLLGLLAKLTERVTDMNFIVRHIIMNTADEAYSYIKTSKDFNNDMDNKVIEDLEAYNKQRVKKKKTTKPTNNDVGIETTNPANTEDSTDKDSKIE